MRLARRLLFVLGLVLAMLAVLIVVATALDRPATTVHEETIVNAPRRLVWQLLTDFDGYQSWNPYVTRANGEARTGEQLALRLDPEHEEAQDVVCDVITVKEVRKLYWRCRNHDVPGVLDREHTFRLLPIDADRIRLVYDGRWEGVLVPFVDLDDRKSGYRRMILALKERAETAQR